MTNRRLGPKARGVLELFFLMGSDLIDSLSFSRGGFLRSASFESEAAFERCLALLQEQGWLVPADGAGGREWVRSLTRAGKERLLDGIEPEAAWAAAWDGRWRNVSFDLPASAGDERQQLRRWLKMRRFGHLQGSVWISHRPYADWDEELLQRRISPRAALFQECVPIGRAGHADFVHSAWNFADINAAYDDYLRFLRGHPLKGLSLEDARSWRQTESIEWRRAFEGDPFLPDALLPKGYLGKKAWAARKQAYALWRAHAALEG